MNGRYTLFALGPCVSAIWCLPLSAAQTTDQPSAPEAERAAFHLADDELSIELVAAEPKVISPVAVAWDADGRMFVAEMIDYPKGTNSGRIKLLEDRDGDGQYERATVFAGQLPFPNGVMPWNGGVLVTAAPDIWFLKDHDGDGHADERRALLTGFGQGNQQLRVNGLMYGLDNWIYGANGRSDGEVRWAEGAAASGLTNKTVSIRGRDFRFRLDSPTFEAIAGRSQFGLAKDDWGNRFLSWNTIPIRQEMLPERYLNRNPNLASTDALANLLPPDDPGQEFPLTPPPLVFNAESSSHFNALAGLTIYRGNALGEAYRGNAFVGESLRNLMHRRVLTPNGLTFIATRGEDGKEFLASTDPWFHPVNFATGPDGALYVVDFYRKFVEHPDYVPEILRGQVAWRTGAEHGRIWRIRRSDRNAPTADQRHAKVPMSTALERPRLGNASAPELVKALEHPNGWWRDTAQRLLAERQDRTALPWLERLARKPPNPLARIHALWTLEALNGLTPGLVLAALKDPESMVRVHGLRLGEIMQEEWSATPSDVGPDNSTVERLDGSNPKSSWIGKPVVPPAPLKRVFATLLTRANDPDARVRFQLALSLGQWEDDRKLKALAQLALRDATNRWPAAAILSSLGKKPGMFVDHLLRMNRQWLAAPTEEQAKFLEDVAILSGVQNDDHDLRGLISYCGSPPNSAHLALLAGLSEGQARIQQKWWRLMEDPIRGSRHRPFTVDLNRLLGDVTMEAASPKNPTPSRLRAIRILSHSPPAFAENRLLAMLTTPQPEAIQTAAALALAKSPTEGLPARVLTFWPQFAPTTRRQVLATALRSPTSTAALVEAMEMGLIKTADLDPSTRQTLLKLQNAELKARVEKILKPEPVSDRAETLRRFQSALTQAGDHARGAAIFVKNCLPCHSVLGKGGKVGPDMSSVTTRPKEALLADILEPSRQVSSDFINYTVTTPQGDTLNGLIASETTASITLRRANVPDETILRTQIKQLRAEGRSLMPDGLEQGLTPQDVADLLDFLSRPDPKLLSE